MSDRLSKELQQHLLNAADSCGEHGWPFNAGWKDFLVADRPETDDPLEMAIEAVWYLADCEGGVWTKPHPCFMAAIAFLKVKLQMKPGAAQIEKLKSLVNSPPSKAAIEDWFRTSYA